MQTTPHRNLNYMQGVPKTSSNSFKLNSNHDSPTKGVFTGEFKLMSWTNGFMYVQIWHNCPLPLGWTRIALQANTRVGLRRNIFGAALDGRCWLNLWDQIEKKWGVLQAMEIWNQRLWLHWLQSPCRWTKSYVSMFFLKTLTDLRMGDLWSMKSNTLRWYMIYDDIWLTCDPKRVGT